MSADEPISDGAFVEIRAYGRLIEADGRWIEVPDGDLVATVELDENGVRRVLPRKCETCGQEFTPTTHSDAKYCSTRCRVAAFRAKS